MIVRENLYEFHKTGDPIGSLGIGVHHSILKALKIYIEPNRSYQLEDMSKFSKDYIRRAIDDQNVIIEFDNPEIKGDRCRLPLSAIYTWYKDRFKYILYNNELYKI